MTTADAEVVVVGGGPAGAAVATALARAGRDVLLIERCAFPRPHVGESLSAGARPLLRALGLAEDITGGVAVRTARVRWQDDQPRDVAPPPGGITIDRGTFDATLLAHARACGVTVREADGPVRRPSPRADDDGWTLTVGDGSRALRARFVVDATGRRRLLEHGAARVLTGPRTLAVHARWAPGAIADDGAQTRIDAVADGWLWGARLPGGGWRAMGFADPATLRAAGGDASRALTALLAASPVFAALRDRPPMEAAVACDATTYACADPIDQTSARVGEAAFAIDPLSACGVQTALQTGLAAAAAITTILTGGDAEAAVAYYAAQQGHAVARHAATTARIYAEHVQDAERPFWRTRATDAPAPPHQADLRPPPPNDRRVRLAAAARVIDTPCLIGDRIERRPALTGPGLDRPVAFLGDTALAPLLPSLTGDGARLGAVVERWDRHLPTGRAVAIAAWLIAHGLLEAAGDRLGSANSDNGPDGLGA